MPEVHAIDINATIFSPAGSFPTIGSLLNVLIPNILILAGIAFLVMFIFVGFQLISKAGFLEPAELQKIQAALTMIVIGMIIIISAYWLIKIIQIVTGVEILNPNL